MSNEGRILVVDDESSIREGLKSALQGLGYDVFAADSAERAIHEFKQSTDISFVLSDFKMPGMSGFDLLKEVKKTSPQTKVVLMTGFGSVHHAVSAMQLGADDYLCKPFSVQDLEKIIAKSLVTSSAEIRSEILLTQDTYIQNILRKAEKAARSSAPVLIEGPSGTGKELLARQIHEWSNRKDKPWVAINCAALPAGLLESELFGFERGAFTGANERKPGKFEQAHGGTLLLDEIGELDPLLQAKLLRVLQEGEVDRLGGKKSVKVDVRIIATTNRNLERLVSQDQFREDLFFRLYGVRFVLSALKDRKEDIALLAQEFLSRLNRSQNRDLRFGPGVLDALKNHAWPGNVRELEKSVERASVFADDNLIGIEHFEFTNSRAQATMRLQPMGDRILDQTSKSIRDMEREIILQALESHEGNRTHTARTLGMSLRTLRHKIKQYREAGFAIDSDRQNRVGKFDLDTQPDAMPEQVSYASGPGISFASNESGEV